MGVGYVDNTSGYWTHENGDGVQLSVVTDTSVAMSDGSNNDPRRKDIYLLFGKASKEMMVKNWSDDEIREVASELKAWEAIQGVPERYLNFSINYGARVYAGIKCIDRKHKVLSSKFFIQAFMTDDLLERLATDSEWWTMAGLKLVEDIKMVWSGSFKGRLTNRYQNLRGRGILDEMITHMERIIKFHVELEEDIHEMFLENNHKFVCSCVHDFLNAVVKESACFRDGAEAGGQFMVKERFIATRKGTIGFQQAFCSHFARYPDIAKFVNLTDPVLGNISWYVALCNDVLGFYKDRRGKEYCPTSLSNRYMDDGCSTVESLRKVCREANEVRMSVQDAIDKMDEDKRRYFELLVILGDRYLDYHFVQGVNLTNDRYGWQWVQRSTSKGQDIQ